MVLKKLFLPSLIRIIVSFIINKLFSERIENLEKDSIKKLIGGEKIRSVKRTTERLLKDSALKITNITVFSIAGMQHFQSEIEVLLVDDIFTTLRVNNVGGKLKIVCDIVQEYDLTSHVISIKSVMISNQLSKEHRFLY